MVHIRMPPVLSKRGVGSMWRGLVGLKSECRGACAGGERCRKREALEESGEVDWKRAYWERDDEAEVDETVRRSPPHLRDVFVQMSTGKRCVTHSHWHVRKCA